MGSVFKPFATRPLPEGAELVTRGGKILATWTDASGKRRQAPATAGDPPRIRVRAGTYSAQYRDGAGVIRRVPTGCKSLDAARSVLADLESQAEKVRAGIVTQAEVDVAGHANTPVVDHVDAYLVHLARKRGKGARRTVSPQHVTNVGHSLRVAVAGCGFRRLRDLNRDAVERWVHRLLELPDDQILDDNGAMVAEARPGARTLNARLVALTAWGNWLVESGRLAANPFARLRKLDQADDVRRQRRALTGDELRRLLAVARLRPIAEYGRETVRVVDATRPTSSRATWKRADLTVDTLAAAAERGRGRLRPEIAARLDRDGRERALLYAMLVTTGLRKGELAALTVDDVRLDEARPVVVLPGADAKNGQRATLPLRSDIAEELGRWMTERAERDGGEPRGAAASPTRRGGAKLFNVPTGLVRILDRDLHAAGIPKRDDRGRTVDVHAMRHTFASHLVAAGVAPRVAQAALRHSSLELTMQHYTDPRLLDVAGALAALPALSAAETKAMPEAEADGAVAPTVALTSDRPSQNKAAGVHRGSTAREAVTTRKPLKTCVVPAKTKLSPAGIEPATFSSGG